MIFPLQSQRKRHSERVALHAYPKIFSKVFGAGLPHSKIFQALKDEIILAIPCIKMPSPCCSLYARKNYKSTSVLHF